MNTRLAKLADNSNSLFQRMNGSLPARDEFFRPFEEVFDSILDGFFQDNSFSKLKAASGYPRINAYDTEDHFYLEASIPGIEKDDLKITIDPGYETEHCGQASVLRISGQTQVAKEDVKNFYIREMKKSSFSRTITLPDKIADPATPEAEFRDGIVTLKWKLKESEEKERPKTIEVKL